MNVGVFDSGNEADADVIAAFYRAWRLDSGRVDADRAARRVVGVGVQ
jgi:hypothetical protein